MSEFTAVIEGVFNDGSRIDIKAGGRKFVTWKEDLGRLARRLEGQECVISYTTRPPKNPGYPDTCLFDGAKPVEQAPPEPEPPVWTNPGDSNDQRRQDIRWQVAFKAAVELADKPDVDLQAVFSLTDVIYAGLSKRQDGS